MMQDRLMGKAAPEPTSTDPPASIALALMTTLIGLLMAFGLKFPCTTHAWNQGLPYSMCYSDIEPLFVARSIGSGTVPYVNPGVEYPVITGTFMDITGRVLRAVTDDAGNTSRNYFFLSALFLAPFAFATTMFMRRRVTRTRLMLWTIGTPTILYAFHNWELLAVAGAVGGLMAYESGRYGLAGAGLAFGASAKLFPLFILPGALLGRLSARTRTIRGRMQGAGAAKLNAGFFGTLALANLPWMLFAWTGWMFVWKFHAVRYPDYGTVWFWAGSRAQEFFGSDWWGPGSGGYRDVMSWLGLLTFGGVSALFLWRGWQRRVETRGYPVVATALGIVGTFILVSKVHSPQFALWLVPLLVMLNVPWKMVLAYLFTDLWVYTSVFNWFVTRTDMGSIWRYSVEISVIARAVVLVGLVAWAWNAKRVIPAEENARRDLPAFARFEHARGLEGILRRMRKF